MWLILLALGCGGDSPVQQVEPELAAPALEVMPRPIPTTQGPCGPVAPALGRLLRSELRFSSVDLGEGRALATSYRTGLEADPCAWAPRQLHGAGAWAEGAAGPGIGEALLVPVDAREGVQIEVGCGDQGGPRPRRVRVTVLGFEGQQGTTWTGLTKRSGRVVHLEDTTDWQPLEVSGAGRFAEGPVLLGVEVREVVPGSRTDVLCIAGIRPAPG